MRRICAQEAQRGFVIVAVLWILIALSSLAVTVTSGLP